MTEMKKAKKSNTVKIQLELSRRSLERLDALKDVVGTSTRAELIRRALSYYVESMRRRLEGNVSSENNANLIPY